ncbi:MAG: hypothetical protein AAF975_02580, partial [Spirochaetota bacterium]
RIKNGNIPIALEVNTHPGMGEGSIIPMMMNTTDQLSLKTAFRQLIEWAQKDCIRTQKYWTQGKHFGQTWA